VSPSTTTARNRAPDRRNLVTIKTFAAECGVSVRQVRRWIYAGMLSEYRLRTAREGRVREFSDIRLDLNEKDYVVAKTRAREPV
jgi:hypothetical protein